MAAKNLQCLCGYEQLYHRGTGCCVGKLLILRGEFFADFEKARFCILACIIGCGIVSPLSTYEKQEADYL